jgi:Fe-Mn family superoxide dismutase
MTTQSAQAIKTADSQIPAFPAELPPLPYDAAALQPTIDAETMNLHHDKHHAAYVNKLNEALQQNPDFQQMSLVELLQTLDRLPDSIRGTVRNNGGGHLNHSMFWQIMAPNAGGEPTGEIGEAIAQSFGSFDQFKQQFNQAGIGQFGSGWVWLVRDPQGTLRITTTPNQDNPVLQGMSPILGNDVWEHAYYLSYQNRRADYLNSWWNIVNWEVVNQRFLASK